MSGGASQIVRRICTKCNHGSTSGFSTYLNVDEATARGQEVERSRGQEVKRKEGRRGVDARVSGRAECPVEVEIEIGTGDVG